MENTIELTVSYNDEYGNHYYISQTIPTTAYHDASSLPEKLSQIGEALRCMIE